MSFSPASDFSVLAARGQTEYTVTHKFGRNESVGTTYEPIAIGGIYRTPQIGSATALRVKAGNANDTAAGTGARTITLAGINASGAIVTDTLTTAGASASSNSANSYIRLYRAFVATSGTYADTSTGSHAADIVIEDSGATQDWLTIDSTDYPRGQSEVAAYTIASGSSALIRMISIGVEATKPASILMLQRTSVLATAAPYDAARVVQEFPPEEGFIDLTSEAPLGPFVGPCDLIFMGKANAGTADIVINFEIWTY